MPVALAPKASFTEVDFFGLLFIIEYIPFVTKFVVSRIAILAVLKLIVLLIVLAATTKTGGF